MYVCVFVCAYVRGEGVARARACVCVEGRGTGVCGGVGGSEYPNTSRFTGI